MNLLHRLVLAAALAPALFVIAAPAHAWGAQGHRLVARVAAERLDPTARAEVARLLAGEPDPTLSGVAAWADQLRGSDRPGPAFGPLALRVNIGEDDCQYQARKHCPDGNCVVEALQVQARILADRSQPDAERAQAPESVVHFVGDIHQPMHAGYGHDKGGNDFQVQYGKRGTNLHSLWDSGLLNTRRLDDEGYLAVLDALPKPVLKRHVRLAKDVPSWAEASCRVAVEQGVYPASRKLGDDYTRRYRPVAEAELRIAGERLAQVLNEAIGRR